MKLCFDSIEDVKEFVGSLKGTRGKKGDADDGAPAAHAVPAPMMPPGQGQPAFAPPTPATGFPAAPAPFGAAVTHAPEVVALVARIGAKLDSALASGQPAEAALAWFRQRCGPEAAAATIDQIKMVYLAKLSVANLEETAKLMGA